MISKNDTTILAVLTRYPDIPDHEADGYIAKIEHPQNVPVCHAIIGRISREELQGDSLTTYDEVQRWSTQRTVQIRNEQHNARVRRKNTKLGDKLAELYRKGIVNDSMLLLYGISGDLPEVEVYRRLSDEEKQRIWEERMAYHYGENWRERFRNTTIIKTRWVDTCSRHNWKKDGF